MKTAVHTIVLIAFVLAAGGCPQKVTNEKHYTEDITTTETIVPGQKQTPAKAEPEEGDRRPGTVTIKEKASAPVIIVE